MIFVGDAKVGLGLGLGFDGGEKMKKTKFEDVGACSNYDGDEDDDDDEFTIDPDISLSYIDEKLQDVLGHLRKDFEGEVSAEKLGAKHGGYGSFLPSYPRSPVCHRPRTPQKVHSSQNNPHMEGVLTNSLIPSSASLLPNKASTSAPTHPLPANDFPKKNRKMKSAQCVGASSSGCESDKNFPQASERSLRVRIKVGSDNLSTCKNKNTEIYSGLGLDISPSGSADRSPVGSDVSREPFNPPEESPTSILQIMTSYPLHGSLLLSPLSVDIIHLSEKKRLREEIKCRSKQKFSDTKNKDKVKIGKHKSSRKNGFPSEIKNHVNKQSHNGNGILLKKEKNAACLVDEGLVDDTGIGNKVKKENMEANFPSRKSALVFEEEKVNSLNDISDYPKEEGFLKREITGDSATADSNFFNGKEIQNTDPVVRSELKNKSLQEDYSASGSKKKPEGSQNKLDYTLDVAKESSNMDGSLLPTKKTEKTINIVSKIEIEDSKPQKDHEKVRDTYMDVFGDIELEQEDNDEDSNNINFNGKPGDLQKIDESENSFGKNRDKASIPEENPKEAPTKAEKAESELIFKEREELVPLVKEDWVCCDKCQKWRLLPLGMNPDDLPEKWLCSMLNWLPGMNRCSFSEEETTKALVSSHQIPARGDGPCGSSSIDVSIFERKKLNGLKDVSASANQDGPVSPSGKNNLHALAKSSSFNLVNQSLLVNERGLSKCSGLEKHQHNQKENKKLFEQHSGEIRRKRNAEPGRPSVSKKAKADNDTNKKSKDLRKNDDHLKRGKKNANEKLKDSFINSHVQSTEKKRKRRESPLLQKSDLLKADRENDARKEKKARISESDGSKKSKNIEDPQFGSDSGMESSKRDLKSVQPSQATSSSSKVSGSNKNKIISKEVKGSPVGSVSSSPLGFLNGDKSVLTKSLDEKDYIRYENVTEDCKRDEKIKLDDKVVNSSLNQTQDEISSKKLLSHEFPLSGRREIENVKSPIRLVFGGQENEAISSVTNATVENDTKIPKPTRRPEKQNGNNYNKSIILNSKGSKVKDVDTSSPARRDSSSQAGNIAVKEAKDLKHLADRLKNSGSNAGSISLYFQAALKFLHGASLLESCNSENAKKGDIIMSMQVYTSTAKLCGFCAHEYEKCKEFAAAALAYKLMEVAYMRVIYSSNINATKDRHELQAALQVVPLGESPCSSVSDIDNLNDPAIIDKVPFVKGVGSPQVIGNALITTRNRPNLARMLNFAQDVNYAMEASKKSRNAFATATTRSKESQGRECISSVKKALNFNFHDVEKLLKIVRLAMDAISR